jgi:hypothetical protein
MCIILFLLCWLYLLGGKKKQASIHWNEIYLLSCFSYENIFQGEEAGDEVIILKTLNVVKDGDLHSAG